MNEIKVPPSFGIINQGLSSFDIEIILLNILQHFGYLVVR